MEQLEFSFETETQTSPEAEGDEFPLTIIGMLNNPFQLDHC